MEYLDIYDEEGNHIGSETREKVHQEGLWHKTVHVWLYTKQGQAIFQIRKDSHKLYTTASGHVLKDETLEDAFSREVKEEIGLDTLSSDAKICNVVTWKMDKIKADGSLWQDRAWANVFTAPYHGDGTDFEFDENEVLGVVMVDAKEALRLFETGQGEILGTFITSGPDNKNNIEERKVTIEDFFVMEGETPLSKYGDIIKAIIQKTK